MVESLGGSTFYSRALLAQFFSLLPKKRAKSGILPFDVISAV